MDSWYNEAMVSRRGSVLLNRALPSLRESNARRRAEMGVQAAAENSVTTGMTVEQLAEMLGAGYPTASGAVVTAETAERVSAVYACVSLIAGAIATLPLTIYERMAETRQRATHDYWWFLNEQANPDWAACTAFEYLIRAKLFYGDGYARLLRASAMSNKIIGWMPLHPYWVRPFIAAEDGRRYYRVTEPGKETIVYDAQDILHVPSLGFDGLTSPSPITYAAREVIGTALSSEEFSARFFSQGATFDYALTTNAVMNTEQVDQLRAALLAKYGGAGNSRLPLILTGGLEPKNLSITPNDAALLPTRQFTVEEICRIFGVPPFMVGHTDKTTSWGSGVEQQGISFVKYSLRRYLTPIEQEFNRKLWPLRERFFVEYNTAALERGDYKTRMDGYRVALGRAGEPGWMRVNEIRRLENLPPDEELDRAAFGQQQQGNGATAQ